MAFENHERKEYSESAQLPRTPKLVLPPETAPNFAVSLDVISHSIQSASRSILVMLEFGDLVMRLGLLSLTDQSVHLSSQTFQSEPPISTLLFIRLLTVDQI